MKRKLEEKEEEEKEEKKVLATFFHPDSKREENLFLDKLKSGRNKFPTFCLSREKSEKERRKGNRKKEEEERESFANLESL